MATVKAQFSYTVEDELGTKASLALYGDVDDTTTVADLATQWQDYSTGLTSVTDAKVIGGTARIVLEPTASQAGKPAAGARVEQNAVINYLVTASGRRFGIATPAWKNSLITAQQPVISSGAGAAWAALLTGAMGDATGTNTSNDFLDLGAALDAFLSFRKHRKQLERASFVLD
jgi:hypothetical protein